MLRLRRKGRKLSKRRLLQNRGPNQPQPLGVALRALSPTGCVRVPSQNVWWKHSAPAPHRGTIVTPSGIFARRHCGSAQPPGTAVHQDSGCTLFPYPFLPLGPRRPGWRHWSGASRNSRRLSRPRFPRPDIPLRIPLPVCTPRRSTQIQVRIAAERYCCEPERASRRTSRYRESGRAGTLRHKACACREARCQPRPVSGPVCVNFVPFSPQPAQAVAPLQAFASHVPVWNLPPQTVRGRTARDCGPGTTP